MSDAAVDVAPAETPSRHAEWRPQLRVVAEPDRSPGDRGQLPSDTTPAPVLARAA